MTCIVGITNKTRVWLGADSAASDDSGSIETRKDPKIFKKGDFLIGYAGSFRIGQLLRYKFTPPKKGRGRVDIYQYMVSEWMDALRKVVKDAGAIKVEDNLEEMTGCSIMVAYKGRLFIIDEDFQVGEVTHPYAAIGSGAATALGSLYSTNKIITLKPEERIQLALEASSTFCTTVRAPFNVDSI